MAKNICILGATGSIGRQALDIIRHCDDLKLHSFSYHANHDFAEKVIAEFRPSKVVCTQRDGFDALTDLAADDGADLVLHAVSGTDAIGAAFSALRTGKTLALANKETLVAAGSLLMNENTDALIPVDSEHSAIYQCLGGRLSAEDLDSVVLTASGGPFFHRTAEEIRTAKAKDALKHPNWNMGAKITVDSATMMNKGLEVIEAMHLFSLPLSKIEVVVHPESIIHSMVRFRDASLLAELSKPDMRQPIHYALTGKKNFALQPLDFVKLGSMTFYEPDMEKFPCLRLAFEAAQAGGTIPAVMNAANEVAVERFLQGRIGFYGIAAVVRNVMDATERRELQSLEELEEITIRAKAMAEIEAGEIEAGKEES